MQTHDDLKLSASTYFVIASILRLNKDIFYAFELAKDVTISEQTVRDSLKRMERMGLITYEGLQPSSEGAARAFYSVHSLDLLTKLLRKHIEDLSAQILMYEEVLDGYPIPENFAIYSHEIASDSKEHTSKKKKDKGI